MDFSRQVDRLNESGVAHLVIFKGVTGMLMEDISMYLAILYFKGSLI